MPEADLPIGVISFGVFTVDLRSGELRKSGVKIRLQDQPFRLLCLLLEHPGELVTREELQRQIWPSDTFVDFDRGLNNAVKRLREALGDPAETPRYIETLPRRGYRFIAPLVDVGGAVRAVLPASRSAVPDGFRIGDHHVEPSLNSVTGPAGTIRLEPKVMQVLVCLAEHGGSVVAKERLMQIVWPDTFVTDDVLTRCISELRRVFGDEARESRVIQTIPKSGYRLIAPIGQWPADRGAPAALAGPVIADKRLPASRRDFFTWGSALLILAAVVGLGLNAGGIRDRLFSKGSGSVAAPTIRSLAVIPLTNLSGDPAQEYFSDGITDALITELAQLRPIRVISRTSVMHYKKTNKTSPEIARELGVDGIVEGTLQRSGDRVRITVQLIYAPVDKHVWATVYERDLKDVFVLERELTEEIARQVRAQLALEGESPLPRPRPMNVQALDAYLKGKAHLSRVGIGFSDEERKKAAPYFQQAIDLDPTFARAYEALADAHCYELLRVTDEDEAIISKARQRAEALDPRARFSWQPVCAQEQRDKSLSAEQQYRACIARLPNSVEAHYDFGEFLDGQGRLDEGWQELQIAQQFDPNPDFAPQYYLTNALDRRGRHDEAIELLLRMAEREPLNAGVHLSLAQDYEAKGMHREEIEELGRTAASYGHPETAPRLRESFAASGYRGALRRWAHECDQLQDAGQFYAPTYVAVIYLRIDDRPRAYKLLEEAYTFRTTRKFGCGSDWYGPRAQLEQMRKDPQFSSDPRFLDLLRRLRFPQTSKDAS